MLIGGLVHHDEGVTVSPSRSWAPLCSQSNAQPCYALSHVRLSVGQQRAIWLCGLEVDRHRFAGQSFETPLVGDSSCTAHLSLHVFARLQLFECAAQSELTGTLKCRREESKKHLEIKRSGDVLFHGWDTSGIDGFCLPPGLQELREPPA
eukprot:GHVU01151704.1.p1 GENE.GHVU01151704.1~~GHVU01151704.1.p1  ORF type:complete len:150 (-),score=2.57 GHVU01151704.1:267-716(-)